VITNLLAITFTGLLQIDNVPVLFAFRFLQGVTAGMFLHFIPSYISELTPKEIGSRFGVYPQLAVVLGVLFSYTLGMLMQNCFDYQNLPSNVPIQDI
jgi:MFS family permease